MRKPRLKAWVSSSADEEALKERNRINTILFRPYRALFYSWLHIQGFALGYPI
jgi:hypothetical protein